MLTGSADAHARNDLEPVPVPRMDFDHEPWVETYRQMFFELKLRNYTEIRALQESGAPPPNATTIILPGDFEREDVEVRPAASWREYWVEWERDWHAPSDTGDSLLRPKYRMQHVTDKPPISAVRVPSVDENPVFTGQHHPDAYPPGWPEAKDWCLDDRCVRGPDPPRPASLRRSLLLFPSNPFPLKPARPARTKRFLDGL